MYFMCVFVSDLVFMYVCVCVCLCDSSSCFGEWTHWFQKKTTGRETFFLYASKLRFKNRIGIWFGMYVVSEHCKIHITLMYELYCCFCSFSPVLISVWLNKVKSHIFWVLIVKQLSDRFLVILQVISEFSSLESSLGNLIIKATILAAQHEFICLSC